MKTPKRLRFLAYTGAFASALLSACGGGGGSSGTSGLIPATVTSATAASGKYSQSMLVTVQGSNLDQGLTVTSGGCKGMALSSTSPYISSATTAYFNCTISGVGAQTLSVARSSDGVALASATYTVEVPQVTLSMSNGAGVNGNIVITLEAAKAPITTDNFLAYIKSGFSVNTAYHRLLAGFVAQGGGYAGPLTTATSASSLKPTLPAITLEDGAGLLNLKYTLAMARTSPANGGAYDSATSQFFINLVNNAFLNKGDPANQDGGRGYAVFGTVTTGTAVVDAMAVAPCVSALVSTCLPIPNITITAASQTR